MTGTDLALSLALGLALGAAYAWTSSARFAYDGAQLASYYASEPDAMHWHVLYMPLARALQWAFAIEDPFAALGWLGVLSGGLGVGMTYLFARLLGLRRALAIGATALTGTARNVWFFSSVVEVHAPHLAVVAAACCALLLAPWSRPRLALALTAPVVALTWTSHASAWVLVPGYAALAAYAHGRCSDEHDGRFAVRVALPIYTGAMVAVAAPLRWLLDGLERTPVDVRLVTTYAPTGDSWFFIRDGFVGPLGLLLPLALYGLATARREGLGWVLGAALAPGVAFFCWWGIPEGGGYFVSAACFLGVAGALGIERLPRLQPAALTAVVAVQGLLAAAHMRAFDSRLDPEVRAELIAELLQTGGPQPGPDGTVCVVSRLAPTIDHYLPQIEERPLLRMLMDGWQREIDPQALLDDLAPAVQLELTQHGVLIDMTAPGEQWDHADPDLARYTETFLSVTLERFPHQLHERGGWEFAALARHP